MNARKTHQYPYWEQHDPHAVPAHVYRCDPTIPHVPSRLFTTVDVAAAALVVVVVVVWDVLVVVVLSVVRGVVVVVDLVVIVVLGRTVVAVADPEADLYQFSFGSPRHSPKVTALYPFARNVSIANLVRFLTVCACVSCIKTIKLFVCGEFAPPSAAENVSLLVWIMAGESFA